MLDFFARLVPAAGKAAARRRTAPTLGALLGITILIGLAASPAHAQETQTYSYDVHGRLTRVDRTMGSTTVTTTYGLDNADNRTNRTVGAPPPTPPALSVSVNDTTWFTGDARVTATPSGGVAPYMYQWTRVSGSTRPKPTDPTAATTGWHFVIPWEDTQVAQFRVTVTDSVGTTANSAQVQVTVYPE